MRFSLIGFVLNVFAGVGLVRASGIPRPPWFFKRLRRLFTGLILGSALAGGSASAQTNNPQLVVQPVGGAAGVGETFAFTVRALDTVPLAYQWWVNGAAISLQTNTSLLLTNLTTSASGGYSVVVSNAVGSVTSSVAQLYVVTTAPRVLWVQGVSGGDSNIALVPLVLNANGREHSISFSLQFDTNVFSAPTYEWGDGNSASIVSSNVAVGQIGLTVSRPPSELFPAGQQTLGAVRFSLMGTNATPLDGRLAFANDPVPLLAMDTNGLQMLLSASVVPQVEVDPVQPELNLQTGLFEQRVTVSNPSRTTFLNLPIYVPSLGTDTASNAMTFYDATGSAVVDLDGDGMIEPATYWTVTNLPPGAVEVFTNGYYVTDHVTSPVADYYVGIGGTAGVPMPATLVPLRITRAEFDGADFVLEWPTRPARLYSVNYAEELTLLGIPEWVTTSTNTVTGTGSPVQWRDPSPSAVHRFYQAVESQ